MLNPVLLCALPSCRAPVVQFSSIPPWHIPADRNSLARLAPFSRKWEGTVNTICNLWGGNGKRQESALTQSCVGDTIHLQDEVVFEENVADDGEQVDQDESQHGGEHDGAAVTSHALDHVEQSLFSVHQVEQLERQSARYNTNSQIHGDRFIVKSLKAFQKAKSETVNMECIRLVDVLLSSTYSGTSICFRANIKSHKFVCWIRFPCTLWHFYFFLWHESSIFLCLNYISFQHLVTQARKYGNTGCCAASAEGLLEPAWTENISKYCIFSPTHSKADLRHRSTALNTLTTATTRTSLV